MQFSPPLSTKLFLLGHVKRQDKGNVILSEEGSIFICLNWIRGRFYLSSAQQLSPVMGEKLYSHVQF